MPKTLVIVESPAKAKTISRFLGPDYRVEASVGHIRDLPESASDVPAEFKGKKWAKLGVNIDGDFEPIYVVSREKKRHVDALKDAAKGVEQILLATDEDREGESISWHILQVLKPKKSVDVRRIVFHEITPEAIDHAVRNPRQLDTDLVRAQETRRILDRLYGYTLSPLLWKKVGPGLSAGRVQSVAVRLVVMRERERRDFVPAHYGGVKAEVEVKAGRFTSKLQRINGQNLADGSDFNAQGELATKNARWLSWDDGRAIAQRLDPTNKLDWNTASVERKPGRETPPPPFMTSTLQQEAGRKLRLSSRQTMQIAQQLYEGIEIGSERVGLITYMRTDSLSLADRAIQQAREFIGSNYGKDYVPGKPRLYKSKNKGAQEAHEAIRPTDLDRTPQKVARYLSKEQLSLYELIWKRTVACQMVDAEVERLRVETEVEESKDRFTFVATGKRIVFPGFLRAYVEGSDDPDADLGDRETLLPETKPGETGRAISVDGTESSTQAPARYTEASLVKRLEEEGIGRPSTYASIIGTIQDRGYVVKNGQQLVPTFTAFAVTQLLEGSFDELVDLKFTAQMEGELDEIADGKRDSVKHLREFYYGSDADPGIAVEVEQRGRDIPFPHLSLGEDIVIRIGRNGPFIQRGEGGTGNTASIPDDLSPADVNLEKAKELLEARSGEPEAIGVDPQSGQCVFLKSGRFGAYLEVKPTDAQVEANETPRRVTLPPDVDKRKITEEDVMLLMRYPRTLGKHPETGAEVVLAVGRYGAYLTAGEQRANVGDWRQAVDLELPAALEALAAPKVSRFQRSSAPKEAIKEFGALEGAAGAVKVLDGRYGPYVTDGTTNATIPKGTNPAELTPEQAVELLQARAAQGPSKKARRAPARRGTTKAAGSKTGGAKKTTSRTKKKS